MSNQVNLMLRPPPNVDFVHGYPGIPPMAPDRQQASVKGEVEVRVGAHGVKAKWVRIELRKVETLPGGGQTNVFYDFVGPSPITLWSAGDEEYQILNGANYPFSIRIPESIPPSIALENRGVLFVRRKKLGLINLAAGIKYEIVASVCVKGKRKMLRSAKAQVVSYVAPIVIDKHELHSTWPVYCQPDFREFEANGVTLRIERNHTCYGPGDRIAVSAIVKSQSLHAVVVRGFEFSLNELSVFRGGIGGAGPGKKPTQPQSKNVVIDESKSPTNVTLYGGTQHKAELVLNISPRHTTTTLNAARHIDITYTLRVKATLTVGDPLHVELPVIISNWQRSVSEEAVKRIGPAPSLSLTQTMPGHSGAAHDSAYPGRRSVENGFPPQGKFSTAPNGHPTSVTTSTSYDDFGYSKAAISPIGKTALLSDELPPQRQNSGMAAATLPSTRTSVFQVDEIGGRPAQGRRPVSAKSTDRENRFTVTNPERQQWMSAEEEKAKLYSTARDKVDKVQGVAPKPITTIEPTTPRKTSSAGGSSPWMSAEEEKAKLYSQARATAERNQALSRSSSERPTTTSFSTPSAAPISAAAAMYQSAMASRSVNVSSPATPAKPQTPTKPPATKAFMTAEEEKAQLRRYQEAKQAVERTQGVALGPTGGASPPPPAPPASSSSGASAAPPPPVGSPIPYDSLYSQPGGGDMPPPFAAAGSSSGFNPNLSEKERAKRAYEVQDTAGPPPPVDAPAYSLPAPRKMPIVGQEILSEKERLRRKYAEEDAAALAVQSRGSNASDTPPYSPPPPTTSRAKPIPPAGGSSSRAISAEEEKALLKARYASQDAQPATNGHPPPASLPTNLHSSLSIRTLGNIPPPPPLMPRPPAEYIQETKEEDARVARYVSSDALPVGMDDDSESVTGGSIMYRQSSMSPPPPLPPKPLS